MSHAGGKILSLDHSYEATAESVGAARRAVVALAELGGAGESEVERVRLAVSEAVSNAVIHGYGRDGSGRINLTAAAISGELTVVVADDGCGLGGAPESDGLGLGLAVITQLCDSLTVMTGSSGGTQIEMRFRLAGSRAAAAEPERAVRFSQERGSAASATRPA